MNLVHKLVSLGAVTAVVLGLFAASAGAVHAQGPFTAYGIGQTEGAVVAAGVGGVICGTTTVNSDGEWLLAVDSDAVCNPSEGDTINFYVDMAGVSETAEWTAGGTPATSGFDANTGITLTVTGDAPPVVDAPAAADTGNAGLVSADATSGVLWLALLALVGVTLAGSRVVTRSR